MLILHLFILHSGFCSPPPGGVALHKWARLRLTAPKLSWDKQRKAQRDEYNCIPYLDFGRAATCKWHDDFCHHPWPRTSGFPSDFSSAVHPIRAAPCNSFIATSGRRSCYSSITHVSPCTPVPERPSGAAPSSATSLKPL